jgi:hypothetical protein
MTASNDSRCFHVAVSHKCTFVELLRLCSTHCLFHHFTFCSSLLCPDSQSCLLAHTRGKDPQTLNTKRRYNTGIIRGKYIYKHRNYSLLLITNKGLLYLFRILTIGLVVILNIKFYCRPVYPNLFSLLCPFIRLFIYGYPRHFITPAHPLKKFFLIFLG